MSDKQVDLALRPISELSRQLRKKARTIEVPGLSQSRRIEGQFSNERETHSIEAVHLVATDSLDTSATVVRDVCMKISRFQRNTERGDYEVHYRIFDRSGTSERPAFRVKKGMTTSGSGLLRPLTDLIADTVRPAALRHRAGDKPGRNHLVIIFANKPEEDPPADLLDFTGHGGPDQCLWVFVEGQEFTTERQYAKWRAAAGGKKAMSQQKAKPQSVLHGYSERGVVNALFEEMVSRGDLKLFSKLFRCLISWTEARVYEPPVFDKVEVYIEHSLSDFGSPDVVLVLKSEERVVEVFFIEAKRETFAKTTQALDRPSHRKIRYTKNCSSILHELFLKWAYFAWIRGRLKTVGGNNDRVRVYTGTEKAAGRYIGKDPVVLDFHSLLGPFLQEHEPIFVTMTTDQIDGNGSPVDQAVVLRRTEAIFDQNRHSTHKGSFLSNLYLLPWLSVVQFAQGKNVHLDRFVREITRNQSKFHPPVIP